MVQPSSPWSSAQVQQIRDLFIPSLADELLTASPTQATSLLHRTMRMCIQALAPVCRDALQPQPLDHDELRRADELAQFRVPLLNGSSLAQGLPYNWTMGVNDQHVGPTAPFYCLPRIAFSGTLVRAYHQTADQRYAHALHAYVMDYTQRYWQHDCLLPPNENWLCTACRAGTWHCDRFPGIFAALADPHILSLFDFQQLLTVFRTLTNMLQGLVPHLALGSNWRVHQLTNLFTQAYAWPFLRHAARWQQLAVTALNQAFEIQFAPDGSHEELCSHYGAGTWQVFAAYFALSHQAPQLGLHFDSEKMSRCADYFLSSSNPMGLLTALGDDYASRPASALRSDAAAYPFSQPPHFHPMLQRAAQWLAPYLPHTPNFILHGSPAPTWHSRHHPHSGYAFLRAGWHPHDLFANLNLGHYANCHCHYALLGLQTAGLGREFIIDPGCSALDERPINANLARTRAHSTLCLDGFDQHVTSPAITTRSILGQNYDFLVGLYRGGYRSGNSFGPGTLNAFHYQHSLHAQHFRHLLFVKNSYWIIFDALQAPAGHLAETRFQFLPNPMAPTPHHPGYHTRYPHSNCALLALHWHGWDHAILSGQTLPIEGWVPTPDGQCIPAPVYKATHPTTGSTLWHGSLLFPYPSADPPNLHITPIPVANAGFAYRIDTAHYTDYCFISNSWQPHPITLDAIRSDAPLIHIRLVNRQITQALVCEGSYLYFHDQLLLDTPGSMYAHEFDPTTNRFHCLPAIPIKH